MARRTPKRQAVTVSEPTASVEAQPTAQAKPKPAPKAAGQLAGAPYPMWVSQKVGSQYMGAAKTDLGYNLDVVRSALQKACRRGQEEEAAWWAWQLIKHGWVRYLWTCLRIFASEDVGMGDPMCAVQIDALANNADKGTGGFKKEMFVGHCEIQAVMVICRAKKDWQATHLMCKMIIDMKAIEDGYELPREPQTEALDAHTDIGRKKGITKAQWWFEGDALEPKSEGHHDNGTDPYHGLVHGHKAPLE